MTDIIPASPGPYPWEPYCSTGLTKPRRSGRDRLAHPRSTGPRVACAPCGLHGHARGSASGCLGGKPALAAATGLPIILYNNPGRTGIDLTHEAFAELAALPRVVGVKECGGTWGCGLVDGHVARVAGWGRRPLGMARIIREDDRGHCRVPWVAPINLVLSENSPERRGSSREGAHVVRMGA